MSPTCVRELKARKSLWQMADVTSEITSLKDLFDLLNRSKNRNVLGMAVLVVLGLMLAVGATLSRPGVAVNGLVGLWKRLSEGYRPVRNYV